MSRTSWAFPGHGILGFFDAVLPEPARHKIAQRKAFMDVLEQANAPEIIAIMRSAN